MTVKRPGPHARVLAAFRAPPLADADFPVMVLLDALLAGGKGFRFTRDYPVSDTEPLPRAVAAAAAGATAHSQWQASPDPYVYALAADVPEAEGLAGVEQAVFRTLEEAAVREWTDDEMARALRQVLTGWASDLDDNVTLRLVNGLTLSLAPAAGGTLVSVRGRIEAGSLFDGDTAGLSALATELLSRPLPGEPAAVAALAWGSHDEPDAPVAQRWIEFSASCLPADALDVVRDVAARIRHALAFANGAVLERSEWEAVKKAAAHRARTNAAVTSTALWQRALVELHGPASPLRRPAWGEPAVIEAASEEALRAFLRRYVRPGTVKLALAGALDAGAIRAEVERGLAPASAPRPDTPRLAAAQGPPAWRDIRLPQPGKSQDDVRVVVAGDRSQPWDRAATQLLLYLLGETGYAGRLGHALVGPGLVYSVYATLEEEGAPGFLMVRTSAAPKDTPEVLRRIRSHLEQAAAGSFTQAELDEAKAYARGKRARAREGSAAAARDLLEVQSAPGGAVPHAVSLDQLNDTARRLFRNGAPVAIVAGPPVV